MSHQSAECGILLVRSPLTIDRVVCAFLIKHNGSNVALEMLDNHAMVNRRSAYNCMWNLGDATNLGTTTWGADFKVHISQSPNHHCIRSQLSKLLDLHNDESSGKVSVFTEWKILPHMGYE